MKLKIACIAGDGIGPEIVREARKVLDKVAQCFGHEIEYTDILMGGASIDVHGVPLTEEAVSAAKAADAVLMGSIGGDAATSPWYKLPPERRPEAGLLGIRKALNLFANLRPAILYPELSGACPLKTEISDKGFDMLIMRELTGGLYFGERKTVEENGVRKATDTLVYDENEIRRIAVKGFAIAQKRKKKVTSVDKANVLDYFRLWRKVVEEVIASNPRSVQDYYNGRERAVGFLVGQTMKATKGKANPASVKELLKELLEEEGCPILNDRYTRNNCRVS